LPGIFKKGFRFSLTQDLSKSKNEKSQVIKKSKYLKYFKNNERIPIDFKKESM